MDKKFNMFHSRMETLDTNGLSHEKMAAISCGAYLVHYSAGHDVFISAGWPSIQGMLYMSNEVR